LLTLDRDPWLNEIPGHIHCSDGPTKRQDERVEPPRYTGHITAVYLLQPQRIWQRAF